MRDKAVRQLYQDTKLRSICISLVKKSGGSHDEAVENFHNSLIQFTKTVMKNSDLNIHASLSTYIAAIARYAWYSQLRDKKRKLEMEQKIKQEKTILGGNVEGLLIRSEKAQVLRKLLARLGTNCKEVLLHWANGFSMKEIAELMNYKSDGMAKKKKHQCMKSLLAIIQERPDIKQMLAP